jgi:mannitol operon transcriptional antiterminator
MLCRLLEEKEPVKLFLLAREVQAAIPTVGRDLDELEPQLERSGLQLVRKRGYGVEITGLETAKRQFIVWMAEEYLDHSDWFGQGAAPSEQWPVNRRLLELVGRDTFLQIEQSLWQQAEEWLNGLKESDYTRLLIRLSVAVSRIRGDHLVPEPAGGEADSLSDVRTIQLVRFAKSLELYLPPGEAVFLHSLFEEARGRAADVSAVILEKYGLDLAERTIDFIRSVEDKLNMQVGKDRSLLDGLIRHLGPALERLGRGEPIRNPLLPQIKKDYEVLFYTVKESAQAAWPEMAIPDEEIGYLTMHFGAAAERWKLTPHHVKALLVCTSGIGSSKLLAVRISKEIPQIDLVGHFSWYEASHMPTDQYDLIISTVDLPVEPERYIKLSPLLTREETERLRSRLRLMALAERLPEASRVQAQDAGVWTRLKTMEPYVREIVSLLEPFDVYELDNKGYEGNLERLLHSMLASLRNQGAVSDEAKVVQDLLDRELQGSVLIPDTQLALYHTRSEWVREPVLAVFRLRSAQPAGSDSDALARQVFLMLAPKALNKQALEVLSEISAMLLQPELIRLFEEEDAERIRSFMASNLEHYIKNK